MRSNNHFIKNNKLKNIETEREVTMTHLMKNNNVYLKNMKSKHNKFWNSHWITLFNNFLSNKTETKDSITSINALITYYEDRIEELNNLKREIPLNKVNEKTSLFNQLLKSFEIRKEALFLLEDIFNEEDFDSEKFDEIVLLLRESDKLINETETHINI